MSDSTSNTAVCVAANEQTNPAACSDGSDGAVIAWQDRRGGNYTIYAQRIDANGHEVWAHNGIALTTDQTTSHMYPQIASDRAGGAYVVWVRGSAKLYAQHVRSDGSLAYGGSGQQIAAGNGANIAMCDDGAGGAFVAWEYSTDVYANHLLSGGPQQGSSGRVIDGSRSLQRFPAVCDDGNGGCFIAWQSGASIPYAIYAQRLDAGGNPQWNTPGILIFKRVCGTCTGANAGHVAVCRDRQQLMLAWEVTSVVSSSDTQNIMASRIRCSTATDTTMVWSQAVDVTGEMLYNQTLPQIFTDDSTNGVSPDFRGALVCFQNQMPGSSDDEDIGMMRLLADGATVRPGPYTAYSFGSIPHGQTGFKATQFDTSILAVWNDARFYGTGPDTCIYAQLLTKGGVKRFPTYGTKSSWGLPICHGSWISKQVTMAPRTNGAIVAWTDYRQGANDPSIYAQLLFRDGSKPIELMAFSARSLHAGDVELDWSTASESANAGFEIERRELTAKAESGIGAFAPVASYTSAPELRGAGTSSVERRYAWADHGVARGTYAYRLVEVALDGTRVAHDPVTVQVLGGDAAPVWGLGVNHPNPFELETTIPLELATSAVVDVTVVDVTGRELSHPVLGRTMPSGSTPLVLRRSELWPSSTPSGAAASQGAGALMLSVTARDASTGALLWRAQRPMIAGPVR